MNIIRVLIYWHSYVHHGGFNLVHITYQISVAVFGILVGPAVMFVMLQAGLSEVCDSYGYVTLLLYSTKYIAIFIQCPLRQTINLYI